MQENKREQSDSIILQVELAYGEQIRKLKRKQAKLEAEQTRQEEFVAGNRIELEQIKKQGIKNTKLESEQKRLEEDLAKNRTELESLGMQVQGLEQIYGVLC